MSGQNMLKIAANTVAERHQQYGSARPLFAHVAQRWSLVLGIEVKPEQVVLCLIDLKMARLVHNPDHDDSIIDIAGYAAVLKEVQS